MILQDHLQHQQEAFFDNSTYSTLYLLKFVSYEPKFNLFATLTICILLGGIILWTIAGNVFVMVTIVTELNIKNSSNHLIFSLAATDLLVATAVMPLSAINEISQRWWLGLLLCDVWVFTDVMACTASILHLVVIGLDRYLSITRLTYSRRSHHYRYPCNSITGPMIIAVWLGAALVSVPARFPWQRTNNHELEVVNVNGTCLINQTNSYTIVANLISFGLPLIAMAIIYLKIFIFIQKQSRNRRKIKRSVIYSESLSLAMNLENLPTKDSPSLSMRSQTWSSNYPTEEQPITKSTLLTKSSTFNSIYFDDLCVSLNYVDEDAENEEATKCDMTANDAACSNNSSCLVTPSSSFRTSIPLLPSRSFTKHKSTPSNIALPEPIDEIDPNQPNCYPNINGCSSNINLKSPTSIIRDPTNANYNAKSPVLSWSPKLTFYPNSNCQTPTIENRRPQILSITSPMAEDSTNDSSMFNSTSNIDQITPTTSSPVASRSVSSTNQEMMLSLTRARKLSNRREYKVARTLFIITGLFLICWMPFFINNLLRAYLLTSQRPLYQTFDSLFLWLGYVNSGLNPLIYTIFSPDFRIAFRKILCGGIASKRARF